jgi:predicted DNA-binding transcriptional regulator AlpA
MELLTVREVAGRLKVSVRQVWKLRACGRLPECVRVLRSVRWRAPDIDAWISSGCPTQALFEATTAARNKR